MSKLSVIVPIYNVEKLIEKCARSLFEQTLDDIEYLFIDDCTPDKSIEVLKNVLKDYPHREDSVRIMKMPSNSRQAAVRREGIIASNGDYIIHCDSDDWVDRDLYEKMYNQAINSNADVVICPIMDEYSNNSSLREMDIPPSSCQEVVKDWYKNSLGMFCWNKMVKRSIYTEYNILPYDGINMWEDNGLMLRIFYHASKLSYIRNAVYHYNNANVSAMTHSYGRVAIEQMINCALKLDEFFQSKPDYSEYTKTILALKFYARLNLVTDSFDGLKEYYSTFPESDKIIPEIRLNAFSNKGKVRFYFVKYHLAWVFVLLFKLKNLFHLK